MGKTSLKPLICPQCSGEVVLDKDQEFGFCKYCGTKLQNTAITKVKGKVKIDKNDELENYLVLMRNASKASNHLDELKYSDLVLEIDSSNYEAWFCKGEAIGWQSQLRNNRLNEMTSYFFEMSEALEEKKVDEEEKEKYYNLALGAFYDVCYAIIDMCTGDLSTDTLYDFTVQDITNNYTLIENYAIKMETINGKVGYDYSLISLYDTMVETVRKSVFTNIVNKINAYNRSSKDDQNQYALESLAEEMDIAAQMLSGMYRFVRSKAVLNNCESTFRDLNSKVRLIPLCASYWNAMTSDYSYVTNFPFKNGLMGYDVLAKLYNNSNKVIEEFDLIQKQKKYALNPELLVEDIKKSKEEISELEAKLEPKKVALNTLQSVIDRKNDELSKLGVFQVKNKKEVKEVIERATNNYNKELREKNSIEERIAELRRFLYKFDKKDEE